MNIIYLPEEMQKSALSWRQAGEKIAFVPTMGALHEGHVSLLKEGRRRGTRLVLSIFVNPIQFAPTEDLEKYPRPTEKDLAAASECGADAVYFPTPETMYPAGYQTYVEVLEATKGLCGKSRPSHFKGVATVVLKLFNIVQPHVALFGEKDYQQLAVIKQMVSDLNLPVEVVGMPTVREVDGIAMSSRNTYLNGEERVQARSIFAALELAKKMVAGGEKHADVITKKIREIVESGGLEIEYVDICDATTLENLERLDRPARLLVAARAGKTRLIDNCPIY